MLFHTQGPLSIFTLKKALAPNLAQIDFEVFWSLVKHHRHSFPGLGTVSHSPSLEEVQDEAASNINILDTFFSIFLTNFSEFNPRYTSYWLQPLLVFLRLQMSNVIEGYVCDSYRISNFNCKTCNNFSAYIVPFQVVKFPNDPCMVSGASYNGTCYTRLVMILKEFEKMQEF